ncbi:MAG TPA: branched-chain amino acid transport system II carrier protein [Candidatus Luteimonas excrementigallinarum]|nr:branched-chain amino acid transport system II carrier protein [Candidatus Luteimonas excrementigallinarum]
MQTLKKQDVVALGFMTFALFLGAGNIIFPPMVGFGSGENLWWAALGFLLTGVGLPVLAIVTLARVGGGLDMLTSPIGRVAGTAFGVAVYLTIGPLFATPRTATVSFEMGIAPFIGTGSAQLFGYTVVYFAVATLIALFPGRLIDSVGKVLTPVLLLALAVLGVAAFFNPAGSAGAFQEAYQQAPLSQGFIQGYLTMDALAALVFGVVIVTAIRSRGVDSGRLVMRYTITAALIAGLCLSLVYLALMRLGATSGTVAPDAETGVALLTGYAHYAFGPTGGVLLGVVITLACLTTAVGLLTALGEYFSRLLPVSYRTVVIVMGLFSMVVANQGLAQLIAFSVPVLVGLYPIAITLMVLGLAWRLWRWPRRVFVPALAVATVFGVIDGLRAAGFDAWIPSWLSALPGASMGLGWTVPVLVAVLVAAAVDRALPAPAAAGSAA